MYSKQFLQQLSSQPFKEIYARITALSWQEDPLERIEGKVTQGSISLDGNSDIRRTCNLTLTTNLNTLFKEYNWTLNHKFKIEIGVSNFINDAFPDIIWLNQGIYLISTFNVSRNSNAQTITIAGKDKMCILNGEVGGVLTAETDFGTFQEIDADNNLLLVKRPLKEIIKDILHVYAQEEYNNIIINDLDISGYELLEYRYDTPLYLLRRKKSDEYFQATLNGNIEVFKDENLTNSLLLSELSKYDSFNPLISDTLDDGEVFYQLEVKENGEEIAAYQAAKITYGQTAGYRQKELTYPGELIGKVGETLTAILKKIVTMLGDYEYFYDVDGRFIFQKKMMGLNTKWSPVMDNDSGISYIIEYPNLKHEIFNFSDTSLFTQISLSPTISNVKNDFSIWGTKNSLSGSNVPIHLRYALDDKPGYYTSIHVEDNHPEIAEYNKIHNATLRGQNSITYMDYRLVEEMKVIYYNFQTGELCVFAEDSQINYNKGENMLEINVSDIVSYNKTNFELTIDDVTTPPIKLVDWREIIYQMAKDYYRYGHLSDFSYLLKQTNPELCKNGKTGYEHYYIDLQGFWRQLYNYEDEYVKVLYPTEDNLSNYYILNDGEEYYFECPSKNDIPNGEKVYIKTSANPVVFKEVAPPYKEEITYYLRHPYTYSLASTFLADEQYYIKNKDYLFDEKEYSKQYWHKNVFEAPNQLNFWFDFLDTQGQLSEYKVKNIGRREKTEQGKAKSISNNMVSNIIFNDPNSVLDDTMSPGYVYFNAPNLDHMFTISAQGISTIDSLNSLLNTHTYSNEQITFTSMPLYGLEVNDIIHLDFSDPEIQGDFLVTKITMPLSYNGTSNITATKIIEKIL